MYKRQNHVRPEFDALKASGKLPFGQVPLLEVTGQSHVLAQSRAIEFYLSQQHGLLGADAFQTAVIHSFVEGLGDLRTEYAKANWWAKAEDKEALGAKFFAEHLPKHYGLLEKNIVATDALHLGDIILFVLNDVFVASGKVPEGFLDAYPSLVARINKVKADPKISAYLANRKVTPF